MSNITHNNGILNLPESTASEKPKKDVFKDISKLHVGRPNIGNRERLLERFIDILDRRWLTNGGPYVREFEQRVADFLGVKHCIAMCNGTVALEICIRALDLSGEVIMPSYTFIATAHALQWQQITPVFCDIKEYPHNIDPNRIEGLITPRTTAIIGVHAWGIPCDVEAIGEIAKRNNLKVMYDAAHAFGCSHKGQMIGSFGDAEVFSFHATKFVNTFEGGAVVTNSDELAEKIRLMKNFGFVAEDEVGHVGTNGKMQEISGAMGLTSLESMHEFIDVNYANYQHYETYLGDIPGVELLKYNENEKSNYQYIVAEVDEERTGISRDEIIAALRAEDVLARRYFYPGCHNMEPYRSYFPHSGLLLPVTERVAGRVIVLPTGTSMDRELIDRVCSIIRKAVLSSSKHHATAATLAANAVV